MTKDVAKHLFCLALVAAGGAVAALAKAHPEYQWTGVAAALLGALGNMFTNKPGASEKLADANRRASMLSAMVGKTTIVGALLMAFLLPGCALFSTPKGAAIETAGIDLAVCILNHLNEPISQIVTDCGAATAQDVVKVIDAHTAAMAREKASKQ